MERIHKLDGVNSDARKRIEAREAILRPTTSLAERARQFGLSASGEPRVRPASPEETSRMKIFWSGKEDFNS